MKIKKGDKRVRNLEGEVASQKADTVNQALQITDARTNISFYNEIIWGSSIIGGAEATTTGIKIPSGQIGAAAYRILTIDLNKFNRKNRLAGQKLKLTLSLICTTGWQSYVNGILMKIRAVRNGVNTTTTSTNFQYKANDTTIVESIEYTIDAADDTLQVLFQIDNSKGVVPYDISFNLVDAYYSVITDITTNTSAILTNNVKEIVKMNVNTITEKNLYVKADGSENFSRVIDAKNFITDSNNKNRYNIIIYDGEYDLIAEQGGTEWLQTVVLAGGERQGFTIPNYTKLVGIGKVLLKAEISDDIVTTDMARCISTLNLLQHAEMENIVATGKNVRYVVHDEASGTFDFAYRDVKKCHFIHYDNKAGMWTTITAYGAGSGSGSNYNFTDCIFESNGTAFSMHNNANQHPSTLSFNGCHFNNKAYGHSLGLGFLGANTEHSKVFVKSSIFTDIYIHAEVETGTNNNVWDVYNYVAGTITIGTDA